MQRDEVQMEKEERKKRKERNKCRKEQSWKSVRKRKSVDKKVRG